MATATATKAPAKRAPRKRAATDKQVREWALQSGIQDVQMRGRVSKHLTELYNKAGGKVLTPTQGVAATRPVEATASTATTAASAPTAVTQERSSNGARPSVFIVTGPSGVRHVLKSDAVYFEEISLDDTTLETATASLQRLLALPATQERATLVRSLAKRLVTLTDV